MKARLALVAAGAVGVAVAVLLAPDAATAAARATWRPFVLVAGLLTIGVVASEDGVFAAAAEAVSRLPGPETWLYAAAMLLVAVVTVLLNLDTSVAFLTPVLVHAARRRGANEQRYLYGCVFMSNAASLLLPGSNLTNLLVLDDGHMSGSAFLAGMAAPWLAAVVVTAALVAAAFPDGASARDPARPPRRSLSPLSASGVGVAAVLVLALGDSALAVLGLGAGLACIRLGQRRLGPRRLLEGVDPVSLTGVFLVAVGLGTLGRTWAYPGRLMATASGTATAALGALASVAMNNLPAATLLASRMPAHPESLLLGLNIGPNLAVTGSLSALIWWQAARSSGARPSARRFSAVGAVLVPLTIAAALAAGRFGG